MQGSTFEMPHYCSQQPGGWRSSHGLCLQPKTGSKLAIVRSSLFDWSQMVWSCLVPFRRNKAMVWRSMVWWSSLHCELMRAYKDTKVAPDLNAIFTTMAHFLFLSGAFCSDAARSPKPCSAHLPRLCRLSRRQFPACGPLGWNTIWQPCIGSAMQILPIHLEFGVFLHRLCLAIFVQLGFWCDFGRCRYLGCGSLAAGFFIALASNASSISSAWLATWDAAAFSDFKSASHSWDHPPSCDVGRPTSHALTPSYGPAQGGA